MTTSRPLRTAVVATALLVLVSACAGERTAGGSDAGPGPGPGPGPSEDLSYADDDVVLRVEYTGGFTTATVIAARVPVVTVYGDGRVITEGPQITIYPGPALPNIQVQRVSPADVRALAERALDAGVGAGLDFGVPPVTDAPSTRFTVLTQVGPQESVVGALGFADEDVGLSEDQRAARAAMRDLLAALTDLPTTLGTDAVTDEGPYRPVAVAALAETWKPADDDLDEQPEIPWPGPELPGEPLAERGPHCVTVTGEEATSVLTAAARANARTPWTSGGQRWRVTLRPLLPEETSCADVFP